MFFKKYISRNLSLWLSFILPIAIMTVYFAYRNMAPFGNSSILTVDLGQQYIDFFAYFKHALFNDPNSFFYSFSKAFGGEMVGVWAYYLMSPFNLLLLLFPIKSLPSAILIILIFKYGFAGLSFSYLLKKSFSLNQWLIAGLSTAYALNGWIIANQLNIIWLDCMILLPLIILGVNNLFKLKQTKLYVISLTAMLIINYYMAYMICLFIILYVCYKAINEYQNFKRTFNILKKWSLASLLSGGLAAFLLLPTFAALKASKGAYTITHYHWKFEYAPYKFIAKFFNGSFNFSQMPNGTPNIFVGSIVLVAFLAFFFNSKVNIKTKITTGSLTIILILSMMLEPLDLLWHAMQFPIWYPYRFSFIFCFWLIFIAAKSISIGFNNVSLLSKILIIIILFGGILTIIINKNQFNFLTNSNIIIGIIILFISVITLLFFKQSSSYIISTILLLIIGEFSLNTFNSLNNISYVTNQNYVNYTLNLKRAVNNINEHDSSFFRLGKTFYRTKDDPFEANYNGGENFSSTFEANTPNFMDRIGEPDGDGFIEYSNGTLITDSLLGFKYFLHQENASPQQYLQALTDKPDLNQYALINTNHNIQTYRNPYALPVAFAGSDDIFNKNDSTDPMHYQSNLYNQLAGQSIRKNMFTPVNFASSAFINTGNQNTITGSMFRKNNLLKPAHIILNFTPKNNNSYYLTLGSNITDKNALITINGKKLNQYNVYRNTVAANVGSNIKNKHIRIDISLLKGNLWLQNLTLYQLNNQEFKRTAEKLLKQPMVIKNHTNRYFNGTINIKQKHRALVTTIPYENGWHIIANGKQVHIQKWANMFIAAKLNPGKYKIHIFYWPPLFNLGIIITLISLLIIIIKWIWIKIKK